MIRTKKPKKKAGAKIKDENAKLTPKELKFVDLYLSNEGNSTPLHNYECYMQVFTKVKAKASARAASGKLLARPHVKRYIKEQENQIKQKILNKITITREEVIQGLKRIALFDERNLYDDNYRLKHIKDLDDDTALALNTIKYGNYKIKKTIKKGDVIIKKEIIKQYVAELKGEARKPAWELLGKHLNMFEEKQQQGSPEEFVTGVRTFAEGIEDGIPGGKL